ncbi:hypothetical protein MKX01_022809 [Papaver californicum]|nr:hypothetical protein MKX01_022809 [Papaver californicum]
MSQSLIILVLVCLSAMAPWLISCRHRNDVISINDFGGVGDGHSLNTQAFREAIYRIKHLRRRGGTLLYITPGVYLTESFSLTSHMTLYLVRGANARTWPLIAPLASYGRGRELPGWRYKSLIHGDGLHDVIITGENGTIDGQGDIWWNMWRQKTLEYTRPNLIELMNSKNIIISNVKFVNSPFWNIHPVYCSNVIIRYVTILAPYDSPNTDGIDPDSSSSVCIEYSYIATGDDLVVVKSGWDEYEIAYGRKSSDIIVRRISGSSPYAGIAIESEASGGVENILAEHTNIGRGGFIKNVTVSNVYIENAAKGIRLTGSAGDYPDDKFNISALTYVSGITFKNIWGTNIKQPGSIEGLKGSPFTGICSQKSSPWKCSEVSGGSQRVNSSPCTELASTAGYGSCSTSF